MTAKQQQMIQDFNAYMSARSSRYNEWYVGVAADPRDRLFRGHGVNEQADAWIYDTCSSSREAREVEQHFVAKGHKGGRAAETPRPDLSTRTRWLATQQNDEGLDCRCVLADDHLLLARLCAIERPRLASLAAGCHTWAYAHAHLCADKTPNSRP